MERCSGFVLNYHLLLAFFTSFVRFALCSLSCELCESFERLVLFSISITHFCCSRAHSCTFSRVIPYLSLYSSHAFLGRITVSLDDRLAIALSSFESALVQRRVSLLAWSSVGVKERERNHQMSHTRRKGVDTRRRRVSPSHSFYQIHSFFLLLL